MNNQPKLKLWQGIYLLVSVYVVGVLGFYWSATQSIFAQLTPYTLIFSAAILFTFHKNWSKTLGYYLLALFVAGYVVEFVGVKTGVIFGAYSYGSNLGVKLFDIPLIIGLNWILLVYATANLAQYLTVPWWLKATIAAALMTALDFLIEPFAIRFDLWSWVEHTVPIQNYLAWFVVALIMQLGFFIQGFAEKSLVSVVFYMLQVLFFSIVMLIV